MALPVANTNNPSPEQGPYSADPVSMGRKGKQ